MAAIVAICSLPAAADDGELTEMVEIMREEGVIDDAQYSQMRAKAEKRDSSVEWWERLTFSGDMRVRYESFVYDTDVQGNDRSSRSRGRYRVRLMLEADINDHIDAVLRIASGQDNSRSTNQTLGRGFDFDPDEIWVDRAFLVVTPLADGALPGGESGYLGIETGRVNNPYHWSKTVSPDYMLWDRDIGLEGIQMKAAWDATNTLQLFLNTGYYVLNERVLGDDPGLLAAQVGAHVWASENVKVGGRFTYYGFNDVDTGFLARGVGPLTSSEIFCPNFGPEDVCTVALLAANSTIAGGNTWAGGGLFGMTDGSWISVVEGSAYVSLGFVEDWPVTLFGSVSSNLEAQSLGMGKQGLAWLLGIQAGDKRKWVNAGFLYGSIQADAFPSQLIDSDLTEGRTNREGLSFWLVREVLRNTDLKLETFYGHEIETAPLFDVSTRDARRWRVRGDIEVKF
jgi:hypothetical protein